MAAEPDAGLRECVPAKDRWDASPLNGGEAERLRLRRRYLVSGYRPQPLPSYRDTVESPAAGRVGICCSGGGIRSAAFNLGALQSLQRANKLEGASYLAAVSGGSYIAAAFAMVCKAWVPGTLGPPADQEEPDSRDYSNARDNSDPRLLREQPPFAPGSPEEQYLRNRCDYLAPDGMSKLYLVYRVVLGMLFNIVFIGLPLVGATIVLGATIYWKAFPSLVGGLCEGAKAPGGCARGLLPTWSWLAPTALLGLSALLGLVVMVRAIRHEGVRRTLQVWATRLLVGALLLALLTVALPEIVSLLRPHAETSTAAGKTTSLLAPASGGGVLALIAALAAHLRSAFATAQADATKVKEDVGKFKELTPKLQRIFAYAVAAIVGPLLFYGMIVIAMSLTLADAASVVHRERLVAAGVGAVALFGALYLLVDIGALSLHHFYKRRLCSAFALKRVPPKRRPDAAPAGPPAGEPTQAEREFDEEIEEYVVPPRPAADAQEEADGIAVERDYDNLTPLSGTKVEEQGWPTLLVCAAANVSDPGATPPGRHVTSFTFSPYSVGGPLVGAIKTDEYERHFEERDYRSRQRDLTLPAAVAMSGAAISPSMGKLTRRPLTFLLALGNVRLGVWVPNPVWVASGAKWIGRWRPPRPSYLLRELFGRNRVDGRYLYVTDGGHYENLGLVELLRRGCTEIYCFDASGGESFSELGDAVALARSELGVEVVIDPTPLTPGAKAVQQPSGQGDSSASEPAPDPCAGNQAEAPNETDVALRSVVCGRFRYRPTGEGKEGVAGVIYYARNVMTKEAPWDVRSRHIEDPTFPHDPTTDQLYTDQKFESYRQLGELAGEQALALAARV